MISDPTRRLLSQYSNFVRCVILQQVKGNKGIRWRYGERPDRVRDVRPYERLNRTPPPTLHFADGIRRYEVTVPAVLTTNDELGSVHLPKQYRRLYVAWSTIDGVRGILPNSTGKTSGHGYQDEVVYFSHLSGATA